ncbi:MAG TPA: putative zinc-binding protein [Spirochaetota bacterium]
MIIDRFVKMCGDFMSGQNAPENSPKYETVHIEKTDASCSLCEVYASKNSKKDIAVLSCEGACLRGEIPRRVANFLCHDIMPEKTVRICSGSAFTKDSGQRNLVQNAKTVVVLEGCPVKCATRTMNGIIRNFNPRVIFTDSIARFDTNIFGINELPSSEINTISRRAAEIIAEKIR